MDVMRWSEIWSAMPVKGAKVEIGSRRGTSSHQYNPAVILCPPETTEKNGDCYGLCFAYSGNFTARAQRDQRNQTRVQMGIQPDQFRFVLEGGETFFAPQVIMSVFRPRDLRRCLISITI